MKKVGWFFVLCCLPALLWGKTPDDKTKDISNFKKSIVLIQSYQQAYDWLIPWNKKALSKKSGAALILPRQRLLTTAELVANHTLISVRKPGVERLYEAELVLIDYAMNLALLHVAAPDFWDGLIPVQWGKPEVGEAEVQYWKSKSEWKSIAGKVKQQFIGFRSRSNSYLPVIEVVASLKSHVQGNPVVQNNKITGMIIQLRDSNLDVAPSSVLQTFINKAAITPYSGFPQRGFQWQSIPQGAIRKYFGLQDGVSGIFINRILHYGTGSDVLQPQDFLVSIGGWKLSNEGTIDHPQWGVILFDYLFTSLDSEKLVVLEVIRQGKRVQLKTQLASFFPEQYSVPLRVVNRPPRYVLRGGILFQELSMNYLELWGNEWRNKAPTRLRIYQQLEADLSGSKDKRLVFLSRILPTPVNIGYQNLHNVIVTEINGFSIHNLEDVVHAFENPKTGFHQVKLLPGAERTYLILPEAELQSTDQQILKDFQIPQLERL